MTNRRREKRNNTRKPVRMKVREAEHDYSEPELYMRSQKQEYETRRPMERYYSDYNYNTSDNRYNGWKNIYRPGYTRDEYSDYDSQYDTEEDDTYSRYRSRYYDDYDNSEYSSYYDEYDTAYADKKSHSECRGCNKHGKKRRGRLSDNFISLHRYEEDRPEYRHSHSHKQKTKINNPVETNHTNLKNNMDIYAMHKFLGQRGLKYKSVDKYKYAEPLSSEVHSETDIISEGYKGKVLNRKTRPGYHIYTTQTTNNTSAFNKKIKRQLPEKLISVTDYEVPIVTFQNKKKRGYLHGDESDLVYLPVVMKAKDKKDKIPKHKLSPLKTNQKGITVYTVSGPPMQAFQKLNTNSNNITRVMSKTKADDFTKQMPGTGSPILYTADEVTSYNMMNVGTTQNIHNSGIRESYIRNIDESDVNERKSSAVGQQKFVNGLQRTNSKSQNSQLKSTIRLSNAVPMNTRVRKKSYSTDRQFLENNLQHPVTSTTDLETSQSSPQSLLEQSMAAPRIQYTQNDNLVNQNSQKIFSNTNNYLPISRISDEGITINYMQYAEVQQHPKPKSILRPNDKQTSRVKSLAVPEQNQGISMDRRSQSSVGRSQIVSSGGQNIQKSMVRQSGVSQRSQVMPGGLVDAGSLIGMGDDTQKSMVRQSGVAQRGHSSAGQSQIMSSGGPNIQKSMVRQSGVSQRSQVMPSGLVDSDSLTDMGDNTQKSMVRQSGVAQRGHSSAGQSQIMSSGGQNIQKSMVRQSGVAQRSQVIPGGFVNADNLIEMEDNTQKSMVRQSSVVQKGQSSADQSQIMSSGGQNIQKSMVRQSGVAQRSQVMPSALVDAGSLIEIKDNNQKSMVRQSGVFQRGQGSAGRSQIMSSGGQNIQKSMVRQSGVAQRSQVMPGSFVDADNLIDMGDNTQKRMVRQSGVVQRGQSQSFINIDDQNVHKSTVRQSIGPERGQSLVDRDKEMETERQNNRMSTIRQSSISPGGQVLESQYTQKSEARQSILPQRGWSFVDGNQVIATEEQKPRKSLARQSIVSQRPQSFINMGQSIVNKDELMGTEGQNMRKSTIRRSIAAQRDQGLEGQNIRKSTIRESIVAQGDEGLEGQNIRKSTIRQSTVAQRDQSLAGQNIRKSTIRQSTVAQRDQSLAGQNIRKSTIRESTVAQRDQDLEEPWQKAQMSTVRHSIQPERDQSFVRHSSVAGRDQIFVNGEESPFVEQQKFVSGKHEIDTLSQQPQTSVMRQSLVFEDGQPNGSVVRHQSLGEDKQDVLAEFPQSGSPKKYSEQPQQASKATRLSKTKSKSFLKRALTKFSAFHGNSGKAGQSGSTAPILDVIMNEANIQPKLEYKRQPSLPQTQSEEPWSAPSTESFKQPTVSKKSKKSKTSKIKSLFKKSKKSESRTRSPSRIEYKQSMQQGDPELMNEQQAAPMDFEQATPMDFEQSAPLEQSASDGFSPFITSDATDISYDSSYPLEDSYQSPNFIETALKGYDLTPIIYFFHIAKLILGVTIFDKLMEVLSVL